MINIIDDEYQDEIDSSLSEEEKQARIRAKKMIAEPVRLRPEREAQFLAEYGSVVVHDFGDVYHLSEEERISQNKFYTAFKKLSLCKHKYKKLDQYVTAMREAIKCLNIVAENNGYYPPDKFKKLFYNKEISISGLFIPQYKGRDKKSLSKEYLFEFIMSNKPAEEILPKDTSEETLMDNLDNIHVLSDEEIDYIMHGPKLPDLNADEDDDLTEKKMGKILKRMPEVMLAMKDFQRKRRAGSGLSRFVYEMGGDNLENISRYELKYMNTDDIPKFKGDLTNDDDYHKYLHELDEWENENIKINYNGKLKTPEEINDIQLKTELDKAGWNMRNLYENKEKEAKLKAIRKSEKRREKLLRQKLTEAETRRKRREMGEDIDSEKKLSKKKLKKLKKKGKKEIDKFLFGDE